MCPGELHKSNEAFKSSETGLRLQGFLSILRSIMQLSKNHIKSAELVSATSLLQRNLSMKKPRLVLFRLEVAALFVVQQRRRVILDDSLVW